MGSGVGRETGPQLDWHEGQALSAFHRALELAQQDPEERFLAGRIRQLTGQAQGFEKKPPVMSISARPD